MRDEVRNKILSYFHMVKTILSNREVDNYIKTLDEFEQTLNALLIPVAYRDLVETETDSLKHEIVKQLNNFNITEDYFTFEALSNEIKRSIRDKNIEEVLK